MFSRIDLAWYCTTMTCKVVNPIMMNVRRLFTELLYSAPVWIYGYCRILNYLPTLYTFYLTSLNINYYYSALSMQLSYLHYLRIINYHIMDSKGRKIAPGMQTFVTRKGNTVDVWVSKHEGNRRKRTGLLICIHRHFLATIQPNSAISCKEPNREWN